MKMKKFISLFIASVMIVSLVGITGFGASGSEVVIIYTNDTHCEVDGELGFSDVAAIKAIEAAKANEVIIVDGGDAVQGGAIGSISEGGYIIDIMNKVGYDLSAIGNHEFDYGIPRLLELSETANHPYICANLVSLPDRKTLFNPYKIIEANGQNIAFIGITTPHTFTSTSPDYFKNEEDEFIYDFSGGDGFYGLIQSTIDNAEENGADIVIAVTHIGIDPADAPYTSIELIANTDGLDAVIDAHSHIVVESELHKDKIGNDVLLTSTGSKFEKIGTMRISDDSITAELVDTDYKAGGLSADAQQAYDDTNTFIKEIKSDYSSELEMIVAATEYDLTINDPDKYSEETGNYRLVRRGETNMANFCTDAYRSALSCDIAIVNGGGVRADIPKGEVSYGELLNVNPFGNDLCVIEATGKQILYALEHGAKSYPEEDGAFLHASGLTYEIDPNISSSVVLDENGMFESISGEPRVKNVMVAGKPIDETAIYTLGGSAFTLIGGGDGFSMFEDANIINNSVCSDCDALVQYASDTLGGIIDKKYENPKGEGRIKISKESSAQESNFADIQSHWAKDEIIRASKLDITNGVSATAFDPDGDITRAMFVSLLYRMEDMPKAQNVSFTDVPNNAYFSNAVSWAFESAIMTGVGNNQFAPDELITREEISTAIMRYCSYKDRGPVGTWAISLDYNDLAEASDRAIESMMFTKINNIMIGDENNNFNPLANATRAETVVILLRTLDYISAN